MTIEEPNEAMATKIIEPLGTATSILVVYGERHRAGVEQRLKKRGIRAEPICFAESQFHPEE